ncbi:MAG: hypothetical protein CM15mP120_07270 [Pseudomonadota bacterium]|nr:MAG: hypothetical protein CM15mP120_07270 [Pseudomonadota bacterium]
MPSRFELANAIRVLAMDAVQAAKSGHPGAPMGLADVAEVLWRDFLKHNPADRFGPIVTVLCFPMATGRCSCTDFCISQATMSAWRIYDSFDNCMEGLQVTRNTASVQALRPPQDLWARDLQQRWVWRWQRKS